MKTKPSAWMPLYVGDYLRDTAHLSTSEHGAYFLMLMHAWTHGGELPGDGPRLCIITKMSAKDWRHSGDILMAFFQRHGAMLRHKRLDLELANATTLTDRRRTAGRLSAEARGRHRQDDRGRCGNRCRDGIDVGLECIDACGFGVALADELLHVVQQIQSRVDHIELALEL